jgi:hypothetical protein
VASLCWKLDLAVLKGEFPLLVVPGRSSKVVALKVFDVLLLMKLC